MIPITRIDEYLAVISQDEDATGLPDQAVTRIDTYLSKIAGEAVAELPEPVTRIDRYLASIAGMDVVMYDPITRIDYYLATVAGVYSGELPEPVTRIDHYLYNWAEGGSLPWQTFVGNPLQFTAPKAHTLKSVKVAFSPIQSGSGDPSPDNVRPISGWNSLDIFNEPDYDPTAQPMTTLSFPSTVYGGTASVAEDGTGTGSEEWVIRHITSADSFAGANPVYLLENRLVKLVDYRTAIMCDKLKTDIRNTSSMPDYVVTGYYDVMGNYPTQNWLYFNIVGGASSVANVKAWLDEVGGIDVAFRVVSPQSVSVTESDTPTAVQGINTMWTDGDTLTVEARAEAVNLSALQSLNMLLGGRYVNNHTEEDLTDEEALDVILGGNR